MSIDPVHSQRIGAVLAGRYRLERVLGAGGMGAVYEAVDPEGRRFAVKVLLGISGGHEELARFAREARIMSTLDHPHLTRVLDSGIDGTLGAPYLVMELLAGEDVESLLRRCGPLAPVLAARIVLAAAAGIEAAHAAGVIHRDIKPANIFLHAVAGGAIVVKVCDFGIAKPLFAGETMTQSGDSFGSPCYMSPEQARNAKRVDGRSDVWSLGMTLFELLTGSTAFDDAKTVPDMLIRLVSTDVPSLQERAPWVSEGLTTVVHGALLRDLDARCPNVGALIDALRPSTEDSERVDASMLAPATPEVRSRAAPRAMLPRTWREVENRVRSIPPPPERDGTAVRLLGHTLGGRYPLLGVLGQGGMGVVYETRGAGGERLALKVILGEAGPPKLDMVKRFVREARALMSIASPYVVKVVDADTDATQHVPFLVMELLEGQDLANLIRTSGPLEVAPIARVFVEACRGLGDAHGRGIVHRDIKPANLFLHELPSGRVITKICDFGVAKQVFASEGAETAVDLTRTGGFVGSPMYFSPEQARNAKNVDARTDVWSLSISLYEALAGRRPWETCSSVGEIIIAVCTQDVPPLDEVAPWIPAGLGAVVHKGLQKDPARRYATMDELAAALEPFAARELVRTTLVGVSGGGARGVTAPRSAALVSSKTAYAATLSASSLDAPRHRALRTLAISVSVLVLASGGALVWRKHDADARRLHAASSGPVAPMEQASFALHGSAEIVPATPPTGVSVAVESAAPATAASASAKRADAKPMNRPPAVPPSPSARSTAPAATSEFVKDRGDRGGN